MNDKVDRPYKSKSLCRLRKETGRFREVYNGKSIQKGHMERIYMMEHGVIMYTGWQDTIVNSDGWLDNR